MARNELTSSEMASLASRAMTDPASLTLDEIQSLGGALLTQAPDHNAMKVYPFGLTAPPPGAHAVYNALAGPTTVDSILEQYSPRSPLADYLRRGGV